MPRSLPYPLDCTRRPSCCADPGFGLSTKPEISHASRRRSRSLSALAGGVLSCAGRWLVWPVGLLGRLVCGLLASDRSPVQFASVAIAAALTLSWLSLGRPAHGQAPSGALRVTEATWHDADTATITVAGPWGFGPIRQSCRALGYDAWEVSRTRQTVTVTEAEIDRGKAAVTALSAWLDGAELWVIPPSAGRDRDAYGRMLGEFWTRKPGRTPLWYPLSQWVIEHDFDRDRASDGTRRTATK